MAPFRLTDNVLSGADVVIFDLAVNEQRAINRGIYDVSAAAEIIRFVVARCVSAGVRPVVLLMPEGSGYRWNGRIYQHARRMQQSYISLCTEWGVPVFDGYAWTDRLIAEVGGSDQECFSDMYHLAAEHAQSLGRALGAAIMQRTDRSSQPIRFVPVHQYVYHPVPAPNVRRVTSVAEQGFFAMAPGDRTEIPTEGEVAGVVFNMSQTNAALRIEGEGALVKDISSPYYDPSRSLRLVAWSVVRRVASRGGIIAISCEERIEGPDFERSAQGGPPAIAGPPRIEIAGLVMRQSVKDMGLPANPGEFIDLAAA